MTRPVKLILTIAVVLTIGAGMYRWFRSAKVPAVRAAAAPTSRPAKPKPPVVSPVDRIHNGMLREDGSTAVGKAFEKRFQAPEWKAGLNLQGDKVVTFHGTTTYAAMKEAGFYVGTWNGVSQGIEAAKQVADARQRCGQTDDTPLSPCLAKAYEAIVIPVAFEFIPLPDDSVEMTYIDPVFQTFDRDHRLRKDRQATLAFIFR